MSGISGIRKPFRRLAGRGSMMVTGVAGLVLVAAAATAPLSWASVQPRPGLSFTPANYNISLSAGQFLDRDFTLTNSGRTPASALVLRLAPAESAFTGDSGFSITAEDCPVLLRPGRSCTITVRFAPASALVADVHLTARSSRAVATLQLSGTGRDESLPTQCQSGFYCITGTEGNDYLDGTSNADYMEGLGSNDELHGKLGDDKLYGGPGNDLLYGGTLFDELRGGDHDDTLHGKEHADYLVGGYGSDHMYGDTGDDTLTAGNYVTVPGGSRADGSPDYMDGGDGNDTCYFAEAIDETVNCETVLPSTAADN